MIYAFYTNKATNSLDLSLIERLQTRYHPFIEPAAIYRTAGGLPFIRQAINYGLFAYVDDFIRSRSKINKSELTCLLLWALYPYEYRFEPTFRYPGNLKLVSMLLERGADANARVKIEGLLTPWEAVLTFFWRSRGGEFQGFISQTPFAREWLAILKHLVLSGADPNASIDGYLVDQVSALDIITLIFEKPWPSETAELVELLKARGARLEVSNGQRVGKYLKKVVSRIDWRGDVPSEWTERVEEP
jgi:hypothetical protein